MAIQNGTEVVTGSTEITHYDVFTADKEGKYYTKFTAIGNGGLEIGFLYIVGDDGTYVKTYEQSAVASEGKFVYSSSTKEITFADGDAPIAGEYVACAYAYNTAKNAQKISINSDGIPPVVLVSAYGIARDTCTGELFPCAVEGQAQVDGNWNFDLSADGEPVVQNLAMEFVKGCVSKELYTFTVYTEDEDEEDIEVKPSEPVTFEVPTTGEVYGQDISVLTTGVNITPQGKVTGMLNYLENYEQMPEGMKSGYFIPYKVIVPENVKTGTKARIKVGSNPDYKVDVTQTNILGFGTDETVAKNTNVVLTVDFDGDGKEYSLNEIKLDFSGLTFAPKN